MPCVAISTYLFLTTICHKILGIVLKGKIGSFKKLSVNLK